MARWAAIHGGATAVLPLASRGARCGIRIAGGSVRSGRICWWRVHAVRRCSISASSISSRCVTAGRRRCIHRNTCAGFQGRLGVFVFGCGCGGSAGLKRGQQFGCLLICRFGQAILQEDTRQFWQAGRFRTCVVFLPCLELEKVNPVVAAWKGLQQANLHSFTPYAGSLCARLRMKKASATAPVVAPATVRTART